MSVICITQARMGSSRLPGKVLIPINGRPMLDYHIQRVRKSKLIDKHIIATTAEPIDKPITQFCESIQQDYFCGDEADVLSRFYFAAKQMGAKQEDTIIRLTGDCPLICASLIDEAVSLHRQGDPDIQYTHVSLTYFPRGFDVEVFSMASLTKAFEQANTAAQREHVTLYLYSDENAQVVPLETGRQLWSQFRLCVDEPDDLTLIETLMWELGGNWLTADHSLLCNTLLANPKLAMINANVIQRTAH